MGESVFATSVLPTPASPSSSSGWSRVIARRSDVARARSARYPWPASASVTVPALEGYGFGYRKFNRRAEDWAMVAVAVWVKSEGGTVSDVRVALTNMGSTPLRATGVEETLRGQSASAESIAKAAELAAEGTEPPGDLNASPDYKRHLARVLTRRALTKAAAA